MPLSYPNPDLAVGPDQRPRWNTAAFRRDGFHNLHRLARYARSFRAARVHDLSLCADLTIPARADVARLTTTPWFSAMVIARGNQVLFERHAPDFGPDQPHAVMSISKTMMNLVIGDLVAKGALRLDDRVGKHLPWIGAGFRDAQIADVLNMNVNNAFTEDYHDVHCAAFQQEAATGLRLPPDSAPEQTNKEFLAGIGLAPGTTNTRNPTGLCLYRSANTDVLAAVAEVAGARSMSACLADIADAAGFAGALHVTTDRSGFPMMNGGICLTARDLARHGLLLARRGLGVNGQQVGDPAFLDATLQGGIPMPAPRGHLRYSNQTNTDGRWIGHGGYGGQYMLVDLTTGTVGVFLSVLQNAAGYDSDYYPPIISMLAEICAAS